MHESERCRQSGHLILRRQNHLGMTLAQTVNDTDMTGTCNRHSPSNDKDLQNKSPDLIMRQQIHMHLKKSLTLKPTDEILRCCNELRMTTIL